MQPGRFRHSISIEFPVYESPDGYGQRVVRWDRLDTVRAEVMDILPSRSEAVQNGLVQGRNQSRVRMLARRDITSDMRIIVHGETDRVLQIVAGPAGIERGSGIEFVCERYTTSGADT